VPELLVCRCLLLELLVLMLAPGSSPGACVGVVEAAKECGIGRNLLLLSIMENLKLEIYHNASVEMERRNGGATERANPNHNPNPK